MPNRPDVLTGGELEGPGRNVRAFCLAAGPICGIPISLNKNDRSNR